MNWQDYKDCDVNALALQLAARPKDEAAYVLRQVAGWQKMRLKAPAWAAVEGIEFPPQLSLEQCSGEEAACYKAELIKRLLQTDPPAPNQSAAMADLTGGLGIDFAHIAPLFGAAFYVEQQTELCALAQHNLPLLGLPQAQVVNGEAEDFLRETPPLWLIFLDPARRDCAGRKVVSLSDCRPNAAALADLLRSKARYTLIKLSPMLDVSEALRQLGHGVREVHIVGRGGECKELLILMAGNDAPACPSDEKSPVIVANEGGHSLRFTARSEAEAEPVYANAVEKFLFEPSAAVMKAGAFKTVAVRYQLAKLHPHTHLYTAAAPVEDFPGRTFLVEGVFSFSKVHLRALRQATEGRAALSVRNFPSSVADLRRKLRLADGGAFHLFATTMADGRHALILCRRHL